MVRRMISQAKTKQKNERLIIADNGSNDGSLEFLRDYAKKRPWVRLIENNELKLHGKWIDEMIHQCETKYIFFIDSEFSFSRSQSTLSSLFLSISIQTLNISGCIL